MYDIGLDLQGILYSGDTPASAMGKGLGQGYS